MALFLRFKVGADPRHPSPGRARLSRDQVRWRRHRGGEDRQRLLGVEAALVAFLPRLHAVHLHAGERVGATPSGSWSIPGSRANGPPYREGSQVRVLAALNSLPLSGAGSTGQRNTLVFYQGWRVGWG